MIQKKDFAYHRLKSASPGGGDHHAEHNIYVVCVYMCIHTHTHTYAYIHTYIHVDRQEREAYIIHTYIYHI